LQKDLGEMGLGGMDSIDLAQDRDRWRAVVNTIMNLRVQLNAERFLSRFASDSLSRRAQLYEAGEEKVLQQPNLRMMIADHSIFTQLADLNATSFLCAHIMGPGTYCAALPRGRQGEVAEIYGARVISLALKFSRVQGECNLHLNILRSGKSWDSAAAVGTRLESVFGFQQGQSIIFSKSCIQAGGSLSLLLKGNRCILGRE
jgi:hypothetical protein